MTTIFDPDISDNDLSTASKAPGPRDGNCLIASKHPPNKAKGSSKVTLLTLPPEIRLKIYDHLLVNYCYEESEIICTRYERPRIYIHGDTRIELGILQTCKQIYQEATSIFYSQNRFYFPDPHHLLQFVACIGLVKLKLVKEVHFQVDRHKSSQLRQLLDILIGDVNVSADEANGLQVTRHTWGIRVEYSGDVRSPSAERNFVRALKQVRDMEELEVNARSQLFGKISFSERTFCYVVMEMNVR